MKRYSILCLVLYFVLRIANVSGECVPFLEQVFSTDASMIFSAIPYTPTEINADTVLARPDSTAFAVSARGKMTTSSTSQRKFLTLGQKGTYTIPLQITVGDKLFFMTFIQGNDLVSSMIENVPQGLKFQSPVEFDLLLVIQKSPRRLYLYINGIEMTHLRSGEDMSWPSTTYYTLNFEFWQEISNVVIYNKMVTPQTKCTLCVAGELPPTCQSCGGTGYLLEGTSACSSCPLNSKSPIRSTRLTQCACNVGFTGTNGNICTACPAGKYNTGSGSAVCNDCPQSSNSSSGSTVCICNAGFTRSSSGLCESCAAGKFKNSNGDVKCTDCIAGKHSSVVGATSDVCTLCPQNSVSAIASDHITDCICKVGFTGQNGALCVSCVAGKFQNSNGDVKCTDCIAGKYSSVVGATSDVCTLCLENSVSAIASDDITDCKCKVGWTGSGGSVSCSACNLGTYKNSIGSDACQNCMAGTYSDTPSASTSDVCIACPVNSDAVEASDSPTHCICNAGFSGVRGQVCIQCPISKYRAQPTSFA